MAKNIELMGAVFPSVPSVLLPQQGGGLVPFVDVSDTTAEAADVEAGKYFYDANGERTEGTASGGGVTVEALSVTANGTYTAPTGTAYSPVSVSVPGGGPSNVIGGTFKYSTAGACDIDIPYTGNGKLIGLIICVHDGYQYNSNFKDLIARYNKAELIVLFPNWNDTYVFDGLTTYCDCFQRYKNSTSNATTYASNSIALTQIVCDEDASNSNLTSGIRIRSNTKFSVYIAAANSYCFTRNVDYDWYAIYYSA